MAQLDGSDIVYVARVSVPKIIALRVEIGTRFPAPQTSQGKVLLAALPAAELERDARAAEPRRAAAVHRAQPRAAATTSWSRSAPAAGPSPTRSWRPASGRWPCRSATAPGPSGRR